MDLGFLATAFGMVSGAVLGALGIALGIPLFAVVANWLLGDVLHLHEDARFHFPDGNLWDLHWLGNVWVALYTLGSLGVVLAYLVHLFR